MVAMRKDVFVFFLISFATALIFRQSFFNFFAQDDFILINQFSGNGFWGDLGNAFGSPSVTHWRPLHSLYFLVGGNLFGKNYVGYHLLTLLLHIGASFFIYKTVGKLTKNRLAGIASAFIYGVNPSHFVSLFWIAGGATVIGFFFLISSFYAYLVSKKALAWGLFILALLASEAMVVGVLLFLAWEVIRLGKITLNKFLLAAGVGTAVFLAVRLVFFMPKVGLEVYRLEVSSRVLDASKYYFLRVGGFVEGAGLGSTALILTVWLGVIVTFLMRNVLKNSQSKKVYALAALTTGAGFFPFILIPNHVSPHYMNIAIFGFSTLVALALAMQGRKIIFLMTAIFVLVSAYNVGETYKNNWVIQRSNLAKTYLFKIEQDKVPEGSRLIFGDNPVSSSLDAYYALGTGEAINFWFADKNYKYCFSWFENCGGGE